MTEKSLARFLGNVLEERYRVRPDPNGEVELVEQKESMTARVQRVAESVVVVKLEKFGHGGQGRFAGRKNLTKICDYLVIADVDGGCRAVFVELKKSLGDKPRGAMTQLRRSLPILCYLNAVHSLDCNDPVIPVEVGYLVVYEAMKGLTKPLLRQSRLGAVHRHRDISFVARPHFSPLTCSRLLEAVNA